VLAGISVGWSALVSSLKARLEAREPLQDSVAAARRGRTGPDRPFRPARVTGMRRNHRDLGLTGVFWLAAAYNQDPLQARRPRSLQARRASWPAAARQA
jgi:hypothetical protein